MAYGAGRGFAWAPGYPFYWGRKFPIISMGARLGAGVPRVGPRAVQVLRQIIPANVMTIGVPGNPFQSLGDARIGELTDVQKARLAVLKGKADKLVELGTRVKAVLDAAYEKYSGWAPGGMKDVLSYILTGGGGVASVLARGTAEQKAVLGVAAAMAAANKWIQTAQQEFFVPYGDEIYALSPSEYKKASDVFDAVVFAYAKLGDLKAVVSMMPDAVMADAVKEFYGSLWDDIVAIAYFLRSVGTEVVKETGAALTWLPWVALGVGGLAVLLYVSTKAQAPAPAKARA